MKNLLMSVAFIALVGSIVPADADSTFAIGGGLHFDRVTTGAAANTLGTAAAGPIYAAFPLGLSLREKGARTANLVIFLGAGDIWRQGLKVLERL